MEKALTSCMSDIMDVDGVKGVLVSDRKGLCLDTQGESSPSSCGLWTSLLSEASKLEPDSNVPTLVLENGHKQCVIQGNDRLVVAIYKDRV